ncbi:HAD family hydrolase [Rhodococcus xishaensis]|uniref:HAD-IIB family hydrolase n=1 Tax=Rhodococcus xishaensis TaxID=2487364 RepID=A0A3S3DXQ7_9NOCA|nr:HAD-IIB family hydrolase [Rhodococcus xishaensis]RVW00620.1 HAD-IIB family hydrolase [Rhodococcus xishaensis]
MTRIRLVASDLDGTLLRSDGTVSQRTARAMAAASDAGIEVVWATARARHSVGPLALSCGFRGEVICANGAITLDLAEGTPEITATVSIEITEAVAVMDRVRTLVPGVVFANVGPTTFVAEPEYAALCDHTDHQRTLDEMILEERLPRMGEPMVKIVARHPEVPGRELYRLALTAGIDGVELTHSGAPYIEMAASGVSKASALARLCASRGIAAHEVAVIGDGVNDVPMLTWGGAALCPENALPEARALAERVLPSNDDDGVAQYLEELLA